MSHKFWARTGNSESTGIVTKVCLTAQGPFQSF